MQTWMLQVSIVWIFIVGVLSQAFGAPTLKKVNSFESEGSIVTELEFSEPIAKDSYNVDYINQTVQIDLKNTEMSQPTFYQKIDHERVKSVYTYKPKKNTVRSRIIQHKPFMAKDLQGYINLTHEGNKLIVTVNDPKKGLPEKEIKPTDMEFMGIAPNTLEEESPSKKLILEAKEKSTEDEFTAATSKVNADQISKMFNQPKAKVKAKKTKDSKKQALSESEIPLFTKGKEEKKSEGTPYGRLLLSLAFIVVFALGATQFSKWWSKRNTKSLDTNKIRVLTQHHLGPKKSLIIVQVSGESILIGVTESNINMIKTLSLLDEEIPEISGQASFTQALDTKMAFEDDEPAPKNNQDGDEFAISQIKDLVSDKLKSMRNI